jgi:hypothetical protein
MPCPAVLTDRYVTGIVKADVDGRVARTTLRPFGAAPALPMEVPARRLATPGTEANPYATPCGKVIRENARQETCGGALRAAGLGRSSVKSSGSFGTRT